MRRCSTSGGRLAFSTDSFVVKPMFFPGGSIGDLAVNGTVNDLAMMGATPLYLSTAFILAEGTPLEDLGRVAMAVGKAAESAGVPLVTGDTKVVDSGSGDGVYVNTAGIGVVPDGVDIGPRRAEVGDAVIVSGDIGVHGMAVMSCREGLEFGTDDPERHRGAARPRRRDAGHRRRRARAARPDPRRGLGQPQRDRPGLRGRHRPRGAVVPDPAGGPGRLRPARARPAPGGQRGQAGRDRAGRPRRRGARGDAPDIRSAPGRPGSAPAWPSTRGWWWRGPGSAAPGSWICRSASSCRGSAEACSCPPPGRCCSRSTPTRRTSSATAGRRARRRCCDHGRWRSWRAGPAGSKAPGAISSSSATATGIADPLDRAVVEAYWVGNDLLEQVDAAALVADLERRFGGQLGGTWQKPVPGRWRTTASRCSRSTRGPGYSRRDGLTVPRSKCLTTAGSALGAWWSSTATRLWSPTSG